MIGEEHQQDSGGVPENSARRNPRSGKDLRRGGGVFPTELKITALDLATSRPLDTPPEFRLCRSLPARKHRPGMPDSPFQRHARHNAPLGRAGTPPTDCESHSKTLEQPYPPCRMRTWVRQRAIHTLGTSGQTCARGFPRSHLATCLGHRMTPTAAFRPAEEASVAVWQRHVQRMRT